MVTMVKMTNKRMSYLKDSHISKHDKMIGVGSGWAQRWLPKKLIPTTYPVLVTSGPPSQIYQWLSNLSSNKRGERYKDQNYQLKFNYNTR